MRIEIITEDFSTKAFLTKLLPRIIKKEALNAELSFHSYKGVGSIPRNLTLKNEPLIAHQNLLNDLENYIFVNCQRTDIDAFIFLLDTDDKDPNEFYGIIYSFIEKIGQNNSRKLKKKIICFATEETEAWYLGDFEALSRLFPDFDEKKYHIYEQDSVCGTYEKLFDILSINDEIKSNNRLRGKKKIELGEIFGDNMSLGNVNISPSYKKFKSQFLSLFPIKK